MDVNERTIIHILEEVDLFRGFSREELWELLAAGEWSKADPGQPIIVAGGVDLFMFLIVKGQVKVVVNRRTMAVLGPGDTFGEFGIMGERRTADIVGKTHCLLLGFNADRLNKLPINLQVKLLRAILFSLMIRIHRLNRQMLWSPLLKKD